MARFLCLTLLSFTFLSCSKDADPPQPRIESQSSAVESPAKDLSLKTPIYRDGQQTAPNTGTSSVLGTKAGAPDNAAAPTLSNDTQSGTSRGPSSDR